MSNVSPVLNVYSDRQEHKLGGQKGVGWLQPSLHHSSISLSPLQLPVARHSMRPELGRPVVGGLFVGEVDIVVCRERVVDVDVLVVVVWISVLEWQEPDRITIWRCVCYNMFTYTSYNVHVNIS